MTSSIARMNCFLHGIENFRIERGDTLSEPKFVQGDRLQRFDVVLANPPYSIKQWDREAFASDPWGRNLYGTPPQGRADYGFWQHILCSLARNTGRCAILFPHGVLFREEEAEMRRKLVEADLIECVLGLGPNLFYNSPMEACVVVCRTAKPKARKGRILFVNAVNEVTRERAQSFLTDDHIERIVKAYERFKDEPGFARVATLEEIRANDGKLSIPLYVAPSATNGQEGVTARKTGALDLSAYLGMWLESGNRPGRLTATSRAIYKLRPNPEWVRLPLFTRKGWKTMRFGDVVENVNETERAPAEAGIERFIGLEYLEPGSLHIRAWGNVADGTTFTRRCRPEQVLFGKRRAYQRKVAVAEFDAVVSGDIYVLEPKGDRLLPTLLPFLCLSERFFKHAVGTSAGSLSPRTNWNSLASFEFALPPLDQQRRIAEILWAVDEVVEREIELAAATGTAANWSRNEHFANGHSHKLTPVRETARWVSGNTPSRGRADFWGGSFPWVSPKDMKQPLITDSEEHLSDAGRKEATEVGPGSVLIVIRGMILSHSFPVGITQRSLAFNQDIKALVPSDAFSTKYLFHWLKWATPKILSRISDSSHGTKRLAMDDLFEMKVPTPTPKQQSAFVERIEALESAGESVHRNIEELKRVRTTFLNHIFNQP